MSRATSLKALLGNLRFIVTWKTWAALVVFGAGAAAGAAWCLAVFHASNRTHGRAHVRAHPPSPSRHRRGGHSHVRPRPPLHDLALHPTAGVDGGGTAGSVRLIALRRRRWPRPQTCAGRTRIPCCGLRRAGRLRRGRPRGADGGPDPGSGACLGRPYRLRRPAVARRGGSRQCGLSVPAVQRRRTAQRAPTIRATSGRTSPGSSQNADLFGCSSRTSPIISTSVIARSGASWKAWATALRKDCSRRLKSVRRTGRQRLFVLARRLSDTERHALRVEPERGEGSARPAEPGHAQPGDLGEDMADAAGVLGEALQRRQPDRDDAGVADADRRKPPGRRADPGEEAGRKPHRQPRRSGAGLADAEGERRQQTERRQAAGCRPRPSGAAVADTERSERPPGQPAGHVGDRTGAGRKQETDRSRRGRASQRATLDDADGTRSQGRSDDACQHAGERPAWPPGPEDRDGWRAIPPVRDGP